MRKEKKVRLYFVLGVIVAGLSWVYQLFITSDIPVSYSINESLRSHTLLFIATFFFILASISIEKLLHLTLMIIIFMLFTIFHIYGFTQSIDTEYFHSSYAPLTYANILHTVIIAMLNGFLLLDKLFSKKRLFKKT